MTHLMDTFPTLNPQDSCSCQELPQRPLHRLFLTSAWTPNPEPKEVWPPVCWAGSQRGPSYGGWASLHSVSTGQGPLLGELGAEPALPDPS